MNEQGQGTIVTLDAAAFHGWLVDRRSAVVGRPGDEFACPFSRFFSEVTGIPYFVDENRYHPVSAQERVQLLPDWARVFVQNLDFLYPLQWVTGEQALAVFSEPFITPEFCWVHNPGGWSCFECWQLGQAASLQIMTEEELHS